MGAEISKMVWRPRVRSFSGIAVLAGEVEGCAVVVAYVCVAGRELV
jgi:hypothetical protein